MKSNLNLICKFLFFLKTFVTVVVLGFEICNIYVSKNENRAELINILIKIKHYGR